MELDMSMQILRKSDGDLEVCKLPFPFSFACWLIVRFYQQQALRNSLEGGGRVNLFSTCLSILLSFIESLEVVNFFFSLCIGAGLPSSRFQCCRWWQPMKWVLLPLCVCSLLLFSSLPGVENLLFTSLSPIFSSSFSPHM